jgi:hypothetical protein
MYEGESAIVRLGEFGLRVDYLNAAVRHGLDMANRVTPVHPKAYGGWVMWAETVGGMRTNLLELNAGWLIGNTSNYETAYNAARGIAIAVVGGDSNTGEPAFRHPRTAKKRGPVTAKRIRRNAIGQMTLDLPGFEVPPEDDELCETWFLLVNARKGQVFCELSMPLSIGNDERIGAWRERIILPSILAVGAEITPIEPDEGDAPQVNVRRK